MKNSLAPLVAVLIAVLVAVLMLRPHGDARGASGPELGPGIYAPPRSPQVASAFTPGVSCSGPAVASTVAWRTVVLSGADRAPLTNACLLALAERITAAGGTAILDPVPRPPLDRVPPQALPADHRLVVATSSGVPPAEPALAATVLLSIQAQHLGLPAGHPAADLIPVAPWSGTVQLSIAVPPAPGAPWPAWYAAVGRGAADAALGALAGGGIAVPGPVVDWGAALPQPPTTTGLHWHAAVQGSGLRAWLGRYQERSEVGADGRPLVPADLAKRLGPNGLGERKWEEASTAPPGLRLWTANHAGLISHLSLQRGEGGYDLVLWQELTQLQALRALQAARPSG